MSYSGASVDSPRLSSEFGSRRGGWNNKGAIVLENIPITSNAADAVITVAASQTSPRAVTVQLNNVDGTPISHCQNFRLGVYLDAAGVAPAVTGGSTGMAQDSVSGYVEATVKSKLFFECRTDATGKWTGTWTDSAHEVAFLGVILPSGRTVFSPALTTA